MKIKWEVEDGYVGKSRPQFVDVPDEDLEGLSPEEQDDIIEDYVQQDFDNKISWSWERVQ